MNWAQKKHENVDNILSLTLMTSHKEFYMSVDAKINTDTKANVAALCPHYGDVVNDNAPLPSFLMKIWINCVMFSSLWLIADNDM